MITRPKKFFVLAMLAAALPGALLIGAYLYLPHYIETRLIPELARASGLTAHTVRVGHVGFSSAELGPVQLDGREGPVLSLERLHLDYTPASLLHRKIGRIRLEGLKASLRIADGAIFIGDTQIAPPPPDPSEPHAEPAAMPALPFRQLSAEGAVLDISWNARRLTVPFSLEVDASSADQGIWSADGVLTPRRSRIRLTAAMDAATGYIDVDLKEIDAALADWTDLIPSEVVPPALDLAVSGRLSALGRVGLRLNPLTVEHASAEIGFTSLRSAWKSAVTDTDSDAIPVHMRIGTTSLSLYGAQTASGWAGRYTVDLHDFALNRTQITLTSPRWRLSGEAALGEVSRIDVQSEGSDLHIVHDTTDLTIPLTTIQAAIGNVDAGWSGQFTIDLHDLALNRAQSTLTSPRWRLAGEASVGEESRIDLQGEGTDLHIVHDTIDLKIPGTIIQAAIVHAAAGWAMQGHGTISDTAGVDSARQLRLDDITVQLPFAWPATASPGRLVVGRIALQGRELGDLSGRLQQAAQRLHFDLDHRSQLFPALIVHIKGTADSTNAEVDLNVPGYRPQVPIDLGRFASAAQGLVLEGLFEAHGRLRWRLEDTQTSADLRIDSGSLRDVGRDLRLTGIQAQLRLDDLPALQSPAAQTIRADQVQLGKIEATDLQVFYRIARPQRLLVETVGLAWAGGRIESGPIELSADKADIEAVLTARDLNLAMLLEQLDFAEGSGQGTVGGSIPIRWAEGKLTFGKGSLSSPPGESGVIRIKELQGTQDLLSGMPAETPQHTQLDIALEALKDYTYQSIDLQLESREEILVMRLQLEGRPNRLLPFGYDQELGRLKRIQGEGQAEFKGIGIDLNFRSPLNEILHYRDLLNPQ
jgi:hypothetical protein